MGDHCLIVIAGPTASGKSALAMQLARHFKTEILSADSRQVYRELEIGTAKPSKSELAEIPHHFINYKSIEENFDAAAFGRDCTLLLERLFNKHSTLILSGGSGLYIKALLEGFDSIPDVPSEIRMEIVKEYEAKGLPWLQAEVEANDPDYFELVDRQNPQRLMRALEVIRVTGRTFSGFRKKEKRKLPYKVVRLGLMPEREILYKRIDDRMDEMIRSGLIEEARNLFDRRHLNSLQTVGYQEVFGFLEGKYDQEEAIRLLKRNSRHYAKRQLTWFKKDQEISWFKPDDQVGIKRMIKGRIDSVI